MSGAPGGYSARYAGSADGGNDLRNCEKLLTELKNVPDEKWGARFVCCMTLAFPDGLVKTFFGYAEGRIGRKPKGETGFGYDPVFFPKGYKNTFAEMSGDEKDRLSHRGKALEKLVSSLHSLRHL